MRAVLTLSIVAAVLSGPSPQVDTPLPWADPHDVGVSAAQLERIPVAMQRYVDEGRVGGHRTVGAVPDRAASHVVCVVLGCLKRPH